MINRQHTRYTLDSFIQAMRLINKSTKGFTNSERTRVELQFVSSHVNEIVKMERSAMHSDRDALFTVLEAMKWPVSRYSIVRELSYLIKTGSDALRVADLIGSEYVYDFITRQDQYWQENQASCRYAVADFVAILEKIQNSGGSVGYTECYTMARDFLLRHIDEIPLMARQSEQDMAGAMISIISVIAKPAVKLQVATTLRQHITDGAELVRVAAVLDKSNQYAFIKEQDQYWESLSAENSMATEASPAASPDSSPRHMGLFASSIQENLGEQDKLTTTSGLNLSRSSSEE